MSKKEIGEPSQEATYSQVRKYYGSIEYSKRFRERLKQEIIKNYNEDMAEDIFNYIDQKKIKIVNPEVFFDKNFTASDPSDVIVNNVQDVNRYFRDLIIYINALRGEGAANLKLVGFLVTVARIIELIKDETGELPDLHTLMDNFLLAITKVEEAKTCGFEIVILDEMLLDRYVKDEEFPFENYYLAYKMLLNSYDRIQKSTRGFLLYLPQLRFVHAVYSEIERKRIDKIQELLKIDRTVIKRAFANISIYDYSSKELETTLEYLIAKSGKDVSKSTIQAFLKYMLSKSSCYVFMCSNSNTFKDMYDLKKVNIKDNKRIKVKNTYLNVEFFKDYITPAFSEVKIVIGKDLKTNAHINRIIDCAHAINMVRIRCLAPRKEDLVSRISISNAYIGRSKLLNILLEKRKLLKATYGRDVTFPVSYNYRYFRTINKYVKGKYIRIISDIHADINASKEYSFNFCGDFTVCCGDISGDAKTSANWIRNNITKGVFVHGNHLGYSTMDGNLNISYKEQDTLNNQIKYLKENFSGNNPVQYLNNSCYEYEGIVFIGTCLYTDFSLYGKESIDRSMNYCEQRMNDFVYPKIKDKGVIRKVTAQDHARMNMKAVKFLWEAVQRNESKPMIIVTHHAPLPFSISNEYIGNPLNPAFVHNMKELVDQFPNIKIWAHGHTHSKFDYIYKGTRFVCVPFGYYNENNMNLSHFAGERVSVEKVKDKDKWSKVLNNKLNISNRSVLYTEDDFNDFI